jgi:hypothetical protein
MNASSSSSEQDGLEVRGSAVDRSTRSGSAESGLAAAGAPDNAVLVVERLSKKWNWN